MARAIRALAPSLRVLPDQRDFELVFRALSAGPAIVSGCRRLSFVDVWFGASIRRKLQETEMPIGKVLHATRKTVEEAVLVGLARVETGALGTPAVGLAPPPRQSALQALSALPLGMSAEGALCPLLLLLFAAPAVGALSPLPLRTPAGGALSQLPLLAARALGALSPLPLAASVTGALSPSLLDGEENEQG